MQQPPTPEQLAGEFSNVVQKAFSSSLQQVIREPDLLPYVGAHLDKLMEVAAYNLITLTQQKPSPEMLRRFAMKAAEAFGKMAAFVEAQQKKQPLALV